MYKCIDFFFEYYNRMITNQLTIVQNIYIPSKSRQVRKNQYLYAASWFIACLLCALLYWNGLNGPFILDDFANIFPAIPSEYTPAAVVSKILNNQSGDFGRAVSMSSFIFTGYLHGLDPWAFKYHNLLLHLANGFVLFLLARRLGQVKQFDEEKSLCFALLVSSIWMLMPIQVSTVLYPVQRMAQLSSFFVMLTLLAFLHARACLSSLLKTINYFFVIPTLILFAALSKENGVLVFPILALISAYLSREPSTKLDKWAVIILAIVPCSSALIALPFVLERYLDYGSRDFTLEQRLLTQVDLVFVYLKAIVVPNLRDLSLLMDDFPVRKHVDLAWLIKLVSIILLLAYSAFGLFKRHLAALGIAFFFAAHLMESTILPLEIAFEHRNYLPSVGIAIVLSAVFVSIGSKLGITVSVTYICFLGTLLLFRADSWSTEEKLYATQVKNRPDSIRARIILSNYLLEIGLPNQALGHIEYIRAKNRDYTGLYLSEMVIRCETSAPDAAYVQAVLESFERSKLDVYGLQGLTVLVSKKLAGACEKIDQKMLKRLIDKAILEARVDKNGILGWLYLVDARYHMINEDIDISEGRFLESYARTHHPDVLLELVDALIATNQIEKAKTYIDEIESGKYFNPVLSGDKLRSKRDKLEKM